MANAIELGLGDGERLPQRSLLTLRSLQDAAMKLAELQNTSNGLKTRSYVGLFLCQAQRSRRMAQTPVRIHLRVASRNDIAAIKLRLGATNKNND